tara:strand:+ start:375 stop:677 length:303 start_codon:yes stop_codon:yes gene_type:complete
MPGFKANVLPGTGQKFDIKNKKNPLHFAAGKGGAMAPLVSAACLQNSSEGDCSLEGVWFATRTNPVTSLGTFHFALPIQRGIAAHYFSGGLSCTPNSYTA